MNIDLLNTFIPPLKFSKSIRVHCENPEQFVQLCSIIAEKKQYHSITFIQEDARKTNFTDISIKYHSIKESNEVCYFTEMNVLKIDKVIPGIRIIYIGDLNVVQELLQSPTFYPGAILDIDIDLDYELGKSEKDILCENEFSLLNMMINSESQIRNLEMEYHIGCLSGMRAININSLLRLMILVCCGIETANNIWSSFLTQELYDPRLLCLIAKFTCKN
jgi:hypothetical protein